VRYARRVPRTLKKSGAYHHGDLRRALLEAAVRVVEKDGVAALSLQALARRAGVSSGAPYHHFESREQLLAEIAAEGFERLTAEMRSAAESAPGDARAQLEALGCGYVRFALAHRGHFRIMFRPELKEQLGQARREEILESFAMLERAVARCQREGAAPAGDPRPLVLLAWSAVHGASALWIDGSLQDQALVADAHALEAMVSGTLGTLFARAAPPPR